MLICKYHIFLYENYSVMICYLLQLSIVILDHSSKIWLLQKKNYNGNIEISKTKFIQKYHMYRNWKIQQRLEQETHNFLVCTTVPWNEMSIQSFGIQNK